MAQVDRARLTVALAHKNQLVHHYVVVHALELNIYEFFLSSFDAQGMVSSFFASFFPSLQIKAYIRQ